MRAEHYASSVEAVREARINGARIEKNHNTTVNCDINVTDINVAMEAWVSWLKPVVC